MEIRYIVVVRKKKRTCHKCHPSIALYESDELTEEIERKENERLQRKGSEGQRRKEKTAELVNLGK